MRVIIPDNEGRPLHVAVFHYLSLTTNNLPSLFDIENHVLALNETDWEEFYSNLGNYHILKKIADRAVRVDSNGLQKTLDSGKLVENKK